MCQLGTVERQLTCAECGEGFTPHKQAFRKQRFCSKRCADKAAHKAAAAKRSAVIGEWLKESANQSTHDATVHTHYSNRAGFPKEVMNNV